MTDQSRILPELLKRARLQELAECADRDLLDRFLAGDESAFAALLDRHGPLVYGICRRSIEDSHLLEDAVQATFLALIRHADSIRHRDHLAGWLFAVARRLARRVKLAEAARARHEQDVSTTRRQREVVCEELTQALDEELERLRTPLRLPLILCYLEGLTQDEAARQLGWSLRTLRRRLEVGRRLLKSRLTRRGFGFGAAIFGGATAVEELPAATRSSILSLCRSNATIPSGIAALCHGAVPMISKSKLMLYSVIAVAFAGGFAGIWRSATPASPIAAAAPEQPSSAPVSRRDRFNDPLPKGALARMGTIGLRFEFRSEEPQLTFTSDGKQLISSAIGRLNRWDLSTGQSTFALGDLSMPSTISSCFVSRDGKLAYAIIQYKEPDGTDAWSNAWRCVKYDLIKGEELARFNHVLSNKGSDGWPIGVTPDGRRLVCYDWSGGPIILRDLNDGSLVGEIKTTLRPQGEGSPRLGSPWAFTPDGKTMIVADDRERTFHVYDLASGKELRSFGSKKGRRVGRMTVSPDGRSLAVWFKREEALDSDSWDYFIRLWDLEDGVVLRDLTRPADVRYGTLSFSPDGRILVASTLELIGGIYRSKINSWDVATGKERWSIPDDPSAHAATTISKDGSRLATLNEYGAIRLWDMATGKEIQAQNVSACGLAAIEFNSDGRSIATVGTDGILRNWNVDTGRQIGVPVVLADCGVNITFEANGRFVRSHSYSFGKTRLNDSQSGKLIFEKDGYGRVSPDGSKIALRGEDHKIRLIDVATGNSGRTFENSDKSIPICKCFMPDGKSMILEDRSKFSIIDLKTGLVVHSWNRSDVTETGDQGDLRMTPSPDGQTLAIRFPKIFSVGRKSELGRVKIVDVATGELRHQFDADDDEVFTAHTFSSDGKFIAAAGNHSSIRVWDTTNGKLTHRFEGHRGIINSLAFSPDGKRLASASDDTTALIWDLTRP